MQPFVEPLLSHLRLATLLLVGMIVVATAAVLAGCGTDPINPDGCRQIEYARCQAAPLCPAFGKKIDVEECERFYKDQCMRGLEADLDPGKPQIDACVAAIQHAAKCLSNHTDPCRIEDQHIANPCELIEAPQKFRQCGFLGKNHQLADASAPATDSAVKGDTANNKAGADAMKAEAAADVEGDTSKD